MSKRQKVVIIVLVLACLMIGFMSGLYAVRLKGFPYAKQETEWSIGIYVAEDPFTLLPPQELKNPVLTAKDVADIPATFVADPFMVEEGGTWYMFFEVMNGATAQGDIGLATSDDGLHWTYKQIVLDEPFHLSYPCVFKWNGEYYMIPEAHQTNSIRLYEANEFPTGWAFVETLVTGFGFVDPSFFHWGGKCWILTSLGNDVLKLYYSDDLMSPWHEHTDSPIVAGNGNIARPAGRVTTFGGTIVRYAQDDEPDYGNRIRAFVVDELTTSCYKEHQVKMSPILEASGAGWRSGGMHHIDPQRTKGGRCVACVDGCQRVGVLRPKY